MMRSATPAQDFPTFDPYSGAVIPPNTSPESAAPILHPGLLACLTDCNARLFHGQINQQGWELCNERCRAILEKGHQGEFAFPKLTDGCSTCGTSDIPACFACAWAYVSHAGIEIGLIALALLGVYLWLK